MSIQEEKFAWAFNEAGSDKQRSHNYAGAYEEAFSVLDGEVSNILEIGIANGYDGMTSLTAWQLLFPNAQVYGADIAREKMVHGQPNVTTFVCDQSNGEALAGLAQQLPDLCVIVDDGSHIFSHAKLTFETLWSKVRTGGLYIIEDISKPGSLYESWEQLTSNWTTYLKEQNIPYTLRDTKPGVNDDSIVIYIKKGQEIV